MSIYPHSSLELRYYLLSLYHYCQFSDNMIIDHDHLWSCYYYLYVTPNLIHVPINLAIPSIPRPGHPCAPRSVRSIRSWPPPQPWTAPRPAPGHRDRPAAGAPGRAPWPAAPGGWMEIWYMDIKFHGVYVSIYIYIYIYRYIIYIYHIYIYIHIIYIINIICIYIYISSIS